MTNPRDRRSDESSLPSGREDASALSNALGREGPLKPAPARTNSQSGLIGSSSKEKKAASVLSKDSQEETKTTDDLISEFVQLCARKGSHVGYGSCEADHKDHCRKKAIWDQIKDPLLKTKYTNEWSSPIADLRGDDDSFSYTIVRTLGLQQHYVTEFVGPRDDGIESISSNIKEITEPKKKVSQNEPKQEKHKTHDSRDSIIPSNSEESETIPSTANPHDSRDKVVVGSSAQEPRAAFAEEADSNFEHTMPEQKLVPAQELTALKGWMEAQIEAALSRKAKLETSCAELETKRSELETKCSELAAEASKNAVLEEKLAQAQDLTELKTWIEAQFRHISEQIEQGRDVQDLKKQVKKISLLGIPVGSLKTVEMKHEGGKHENSSKGHNASSSSSS